MSKSLLIFLIACIAPAAPAQSTTEDSRHIEVFVGYSQNRIKAQTLDENNRPSIKRLGFNGFNAQVTAKINNFLGVTGDVAGHYRSDTLIGFGGSERTKTQLYNFLGGPQVKARNSSRFTPFAHALFGVAHLRHAISFPGGKFTDSRTDFAMAFGGGLDVGLSKRIALRVIQADYNPTFFDDRQNNIRFSFGIVFK